MLMVKTFGALVCAAWLAGCAGGANVYSQPVAEFAQAVDQTARVVSGYAAMAHRNAVSGVIAETAQGGDVIGYSAQNCTAAKTADDCVLSKGKTSDPLLSQDLRKPSGEVAMMGKLQTYARLLVGIAGAASDAELKQRQKAAEAAYGDLWQGVKDVKGQDFAAAKGDFKAAISNGLGSMYLENIRVKLLGQLVKSADPVVGAASDTLASFMGDMQAQFLTQQNARLIQGIANFDVLAKGYSATQTSLEAARYQILRRTALKGAVSDIAQLRAVLHADPKAAFGEMKAAHTALLRALTLADSDLGKALVAIENFSAAAKRASAVYDSLMGWM